VLGASGFIGEALLHTLAARGVRTTCLIHRTPPSSGGAVRRGSIATFPWRSLENDEPDVIFHLARIPERGRFRGAVTRIQNRAANERLAAWVAGSARPPLVIYVGGTLAYGSRGEAPVTEDTPLAPTSFSRAYHVAERPWLRMLAWGDAPVIVARPAWVLGAASWFEVYFRKVLREERVVPLYGEGDNWMSLVHVQDCAAMLLHAARHALPMTAINLFTHSPMRQRDFVERLARLTRLRVRRISLDETEARYGKLVREAFTFSARIGTIHTDVHSAYRPIHGDLDRALAELLSD
jgi:nucleoside-diphosphate-sugar epimerase